MPATIPFRSFTLADTIRWLPSGLGHYWPGGGNSFSGVAYDVIGDGANGAIYGTVQGNVALGDGPAGDMALSFGGTDADYMPLSACPFASTAEAGNQSVAMWGLIRDITVSPDGAGTNPTFLNFTADAGSTAVMIQHAFGTSGVGMLDFQVGGNAIISNAILISNVWFHLGCTNDAGTKNMYVNGVSVATSTGAFSVGNSNNFSSRNAGTRPINGSMAHVMTWERTLSAEEAYRVYALMSGVFQPIEAQIMQATIVSDTLFAQAWM